MTQSMLSTDVAILGSGTAGLTAYRAATSAGARTLLIDPGPFGTTCARVGCMPSKLLIAAAEVAHDARDAGPFGVHASVEVRGREVMDRVRRERDRFVGFVLDDIKRIPDQDRILGRGRFVEPGVLDVNGQRIEARAVVIATGSSPAIPSMFEAVRPWVVLNDDVFSWEDLPASVAVFGAGVIGLELGQALHRLGVRTRLFGLGGFVGPLSDPAIKGAAERAFAAEFPCDFNANVTSLVPRDGGVEVRWIKTDGSEASAVFAKILVATGRRPNLAGLGLEVAAPGLWENGRLVGYNRTTTQMGSAPIFIAGDANNDLPLLHEAADEGRIAGENAAQFPEIREGSRRTPIAVVFSDPQLAMVGSSFAEVTRRGDFVVGEVSFENQGRSRVLRKNRGMLHVYADSSTGQLLGAEVAGPRAEHLAHLLSWSHQMGLTVAQMLAMPFYHPVIEEGLRTALRHAASQIRR